MFDPSPEATLARRYQAAAERGFYKALKQLRQMEREAEALLKADDANRVDTIMASFLASQKAGRKMDDEMDALYPELAMPMPSRPANSPQVSATPSRVDVPMNIGRPR